MERILQSAPFTASETFYEDGAAVDPGVVTIGITRADGTVLVAPLTATAGSGAAARTYALTVANTLLLDTLTLTWTSATKGIRKSTIQVVGGFLFQLSELGALKTGGSSTIAATYSAAEIATARLFAETELERECGEYGFVPRYSYETVNGDNGDTIRLTGWPIRTIRSVISTDTNGAQTTYTASQITGLRFQGGVVSNITSGWTAGYGNFTVGYEYGSDYPPSGASEAALILAKSRIVRGPVDDRATQQPSEYGPINLATPGMFGSRYGLPAVDAFIRANKIPNIA